MQTDYPHNVHSELPGERPLEPVPPEFPAPVLAETVHPEFPAPVLAETMPSEVPMGRAAPLSFFKMLKELRSWGTWLLIMGVLNCVTSYTNPAFGIMLLIAGLASFYYRTAAMFGLYSITLLWAAVSNAFSGSAGWMVFSVVQIFLGIQTLRQFIHFRNVEREYLVSGELTDTEMAPYRRATKAFPAIAFVLGLATLGLLVTAFGLAFTTGVIKSDNGIVPTWMLPVAEVMFSASEVAGILGLGMGLGGLLSKYPQRVFIIVGVILNALSLVIRFVFLLL